ncbi:protein-L-isoaspartate O-methyltransferase family protein [Peredibacter sp. HCB2-198]|uniref:protein-L-isoaspartate O-methyltransferase family protein n=1 Tax=Peredibacter sp. HCB2-198 TaxID=3383025 RepID=UPI0038B50D87
MNYEPYLEKLLSYSVSRYHLSPEIAEAYRKSPRHLFIQENYSIEEMYADYPLGIYQDDKFVSTISQPSFVLLMLDMLDLHPGQKVIELGAGSGWNAALMSHLVGPTGKVVSLEIIPDLARATQANIKKMNLPNLEILLADGAEGYEPEAPYDRGIFTAGASDLPRAFHEQIKVGGKLLFVLKGFRYSDQLLLLEKKEDHFESIDTLACSFVPMKGQYESYPDPELDQVIESRNKILIYPNRRDLPASERKVVREDSVFYF